MDLKKDILFFNCNLESIILEPHLELSVLRQVEEKLLVNRSDQIQ